MIEKRDKNTVAPAVDEKMQSAISYVRSYTEKLNRSGHLPRAYVMTFGCQGNEADSERLAGFAEAMGYELSPTYEGTDLVLVNTCAVREHAEKKALSSIGQLKHVKAENPDMIIGVGGCMTSQQHRVDTLKQSYPYVDFCFTTTELLRVPELIADRISGGSRRFPNTKESLLSTDFSESMPIKRESASHAWVNIMYGCNNFCTYCIVPYVRGRERSRLPEDIYREVKALAEAGCHDITLLGQNVNSYGHDLSCGMDFAPLLGTLADIEGDFRLRFMTSHPTDATEELIDVIASHERIAKHFHLPLQSGSDHVLLEMNRRYTAKDYIKIVDNLRAKIPEIALTSDIMIGFPGETEEDFEMTLEAIRRARFDMIYAFIYSPRAGTPAAKREDQVPDTVKSERFSRLIECQNEISKEQNEKLIGKTLRVLMDDDLSGGATGRTDGNKQIHVSGQVSAGEFINVKVTRADTYNLFGEAL